MPKDRDESHLAPADRESPRRSRPALVGTPPLTEGQSRRRARMSDNPPPPATDYDTAVRDLDLDATLLRDQIIMNVSSDHMKPERQNFLIGQMNMERTLFLSVAIQQLVETRRIANALEDMAASHDADRREKKAKKRLQAGLEAYKRELKKSAKKS